MRLRDVAERVRVTERTAQRIISDLDRPLRHPVERGHLLGEILEVLNDRAPGAAEGCP